MRFGTYRTDLVACIVLALFAAFIIGAGDIRQSDPRGTMLVVAAAGATLGFVFPRHVVFTAVILGLAAPTAHVLSRLNQWTADGAPTSLWWTLLAVILAIVAAAAGGAIRRLIAGRSSPQQR